MPNVFHRASIPRRQRVWRRYALGHLVGGPGAILAIQLMQALEWIGGRRGIVTMCIGGGQGMAAIFERSYRILTLRFSYASRGRIEGIGGSLINLLRRAAVQ